MMFHRWVGALMGLAMMGMAGAANAELISVSDQQAITTSGQTFTFTFDPLPNSDGTGGQFLFTVNGDYSGFDLETSVITLDIAGGVLDLGNGTNGIVSNTIAGLTLDSFSSVTFSFNDRELSWVFDMSAALLASILGDNKIVVGVLNDAAVDIFGETNPDFVRVGFTYVSVPEPSTLALFGIGLAGLGFMTRRRRNRRRQN